MKGRWSTGREIHHVVMASWRTLRVLTSKKSWNLYIQNLGVCLHLLASRLADGIVNTYLTSMKISSTRPSLAFLKAFSSLPVTIVSHPPGHVTLLWASPNRLPIQLRTQTRVFEILHGGYIPRDMKIPLCWVSILSLSPAVPRN